MLCSMLSTGGTFHVPAGEFYVSQAQVVRHPYPRPFAWTHTCVDVDWQSCWAAFGGRWVGVGWGGVATMGGNGGKGELVQATAASTPDGCWHGRSLLSLQFLLHPAPRCSQQGWIDCTGLVEVIVVSLVFSLLLQHVVCMLGQCGTKLHTMLVHCSSVVCPGQARHHDRAAGLGI
jgi:hypothetical protein